MANERSVLRDNSIEMEQVLRDWRRNMLNVLYKISIPMVAVGIGIMVISDVIPHPDQIIALIVYTVIWAVFILMALRPNWNHKLRAWVFLGLIYLIAVMTLMRGGLAGDGRLFLLSLPVLATILIGIFPALVTMVMGLLTLLVFIYLSSTGILNEWVYDTLITDPLDTSHWIVVSFYTMLIMGIVVTLLSLFYQFLIKAIESERNARRESSEARAQLQEYSQKLEEMVKGRTIELAAAMQEATDARIAAETADRSKSAFLATMSHEIRTPLNAIIGMTSLLLDTPLTVKQGEFAETIRTSGEQLLTLINDILDFSKIEAGRMDLEQTPFLVRQCLENVIDQVNQRAQEKKIELVLMVEQSVPAAIVGDETRLRQILSNLLSNAVKFTEQGEVEINVRAEALDCPADYAAQTDPDGKTIGYAQRYQLTFTVRDTGIGIPAENIEQLFQPFRQGDAGMTRRYGGTGLGLVISKRLVEMMNGKIWVESSAGSGSTFSFTIEAKATASPRRKPRLEAQLDLREKHILIVDDNTTNRRILALQFQAWSMQPKATASPFEALSWLRQGETFDAAVIDMEMAEMDGISLAKEMRKNKNGRCLPIIMLSSLGQAPSAANQELFAAVLTKPAKASQLYNAMIAIFAGEVEQILRQTNLVLPQFDPQMGIRHPLRILLVEDNNINQNLVILMLERMGYRADVAGNGLEALDALRRQPYDAVLMDVQMPEMDGLVATQRIRQDFAESVQPRIIAMTANAMSGDREICLDAGMDDYIAKPIHIEELVNCLNRCDTREIRDQSLAREYNLSAEPLGPRLENLPPLEPGEIIDLSELLRLKDTLGSRVELMLPSLVSSFFKQAEKLLDESRMALEEARLEDLRRAAHTLKSNSASFGAKTLAECARRIEEQAHLGVTDGVAGQLRAAELEYVRVQAALQTAVEQMLDGAPEKHAGADD